MELIEVKPSSISLRFPDALSAEVTVLNLTLHQLAVRVLCTNPDNFLITPSVFSLGSFEELKLRVQVKYYQEALLSNYLGNKIMLYCYDQDQDGELWNDLGMTNDKLRRIARTQLQLNCTAQMQQHVVVQPKKKHLLLRVHRYAGPTVLSSNEKHTLITFLETLGDLKCLHALGDGDFIAEYRQLLHNSVSLVQELPMSDDKLALYSISIVPIIGKERLPEPEDKSPTSEQKKLQSEAFEVVLQQRDFKPQVEVVKENPVQREQIQLAPSPAKSKRSNDLMSTFIGPGNSNKTTFAASSGLRKRRRNKSQEAVRNVYSSGEEDEEDQQQKMFVDSRMVVLNPMPSPSNLHHHRKEQPPLRIAPPIQTKKKEPRLQKHETMNCISQPLSMLASGNKYFILFANALVMYETEKKISQGKTIHLQVTSAFNEHKSKKVFMKYYSNYVLMGCNYSFFIVNLQERLAEEIQVQRKEINDVAVLKQHKLVAVGGKNFSKFSMFGKSTQRSNIKLYELQGRHNHTLTFDIENAGVILQLQEIEIQGNHVLTAFGELESLQSLYLLNVISAVKIEIVGRFDLRDDLALQQIKYLQYSANQVYGLECMHIENRELMAVKRFHLKLSGWKSSIATETCSIKQGLYSFFESDDRYLVVYSLSSAQLTLYDLTTKTSLQLQITPGFRMLRLAHPYVYLLYDNCVEIKTIVSE